MRRIVTISTRTVHDVVYDLDGTRNVGYDHAKQCLSATGRLKVRLFVGMDTLVRKIICWGAVD